MDLWGPRIDPLVILAQSLYEEPKKRIEVLCFIRLSGKSPPAASFQDRSLMMFLNIFFVYGLNTIYFQWKFFASI